MPIITFGNSLEASTMTHVFHRHTQSLMPEAASASGLEITDTNGKTYIDACGGAAVSCLGHNHPEVIAAVADQLGGWTMCTAVSSPAALQKNWPRFC
ncbi:MAG: aminotransferase class III-fold pyridoxal phosphate-dependent enzyme [Betaproteobacteria bacterium]|nr:aminotransferase class III-fold pyridoxal phosphate-dependent enzyme [Betaproteobacteria bacterium]